MLGGYASSDRPARSDAPCRLTPATTPGSRCLSSLDRRPVSAPPTASNARRVASSAASLITTSPPASRTLLAMGTYKAFRERFAAIHPRYLTPS
jgi:hypothetical protein